MSSKPRYLAETASNASPLYAHKGGVRVRSMVAPLDDLEHRREWGGGADSRARPRLGSGQD